MMDPQPYQLGHPKLQASMHVTIKIFRQYLPEYRLQWSPNSHTFIYSLSVWEAFIPDSHTLSVFSFRSAYIISLMSAAVGQWCNADICDSRLQWMCGTIRPATITIIDGKYFVKVCSVVLLQLRCASKNMTCWTTMHATNCDWSKNACLPACLRLSMLVLRLACQTVLTYSRNFTNYFPSKIVEAFW